MNAIQEGLGYARQTGDSILQLLGVQNEKLDRLISKPEPKPLSKLNVVSEGQLRTFPIAPVATIQPIFTVPQGLFLRIDQWVWRNLDGDESNFRLFYGDTNLPLLLDVASNNIPAGFGKSIPNHMLLPPNTNLLGAWEGGGSLQVGNGTLTMLTTSFQLTL